MTAPLTNISNGTLNQRKVISHTITGLKRWSCHGGELPRKSCSLRPWSLLTNIQLSVGLKQSMSTTSTIPVNSSAPVNQSMSLPLIVFMSPLPNQKLWHPSTIGLLQAEDVFVNGGWWHDDRILAATGQGVEKEEPRAWEGWWNENIVRFKMYPQDKD